MSFALPFRLPMSRNARLVCVTILVLGAVAVVSRVQHKPKPWPVKKVPIAFWAWRNHSPAEADVRQAMAQTGARAIFQRAGQIDYHQDKLRRIRPLHGAWPRGIDLHLVYNATPSLLSQIEQVNEEVLARSIIAAFREDEGRAVQQHARVVGLQIDFDVPTRLLNRYERILRPLRAELKPGTQLSITGLPTWMQSTELASTLTKVDFWIPQLYGAEVPQRVEQLIPISSARHIESFVNGARKLEKPFYAGLAAYSWALLYDKSGTLISLRGDLDPATVAADPNLELIDHRPFDATATAVSEWRHVYRARADGVIDGLAMHAGDTLVLNVPSAESFRAATRIVREWAGANLLGICVFRLPAANDRATLTIEQVAAGLADKEAVPDLRIYFKTDKEHPGKWLFEIVNKGSAGVTGLKIDVPVEPGAIESVVPPKGASSESICHLPNADNSSAYQPCGQHRANLIRIVAPPLRPGQTLRAMVVLRTTSSSVPSVSIVAQTDAGLPYLARREILVESDLEQ